MTGFYTDAIGRMARKKHRCSYCGEAINAGDAYQYQDGIWEGSWFKSRMHPECFDDMCENGDGEYSPYSHERPSAKATS